MQLKASAPGSLMLLGEYAVLHGYPALLCAIDKRITVKMTDREDDFIHIHSDLYGQHVTTLNAIKIIQPFQFVLASLKQNQTKLKKGCNIFITSCFSDKIGFGSSAALTVAMLAVLNARLGNAIDTMKLINEGRQVIQTVQGLGSGADVAASVMGGIVAYQMGASTIQKFSALHALVAWYVGFKTKTADAINAVTTRFAHKPKIFSDLCKAIGECSQEGIKCVANENWDTLGTLFNHQQTLMQELGVSLPQLENMIEILRRQPDIKGAKISGSGMGDSVIGLGEGSQLMNNFPLIPVSMSLQGVQLEKT